MLAQVAGRGKRSKGKVQRQDTRPNAAEVAAGEGAVFLFGLTADPGVLTVDRWMVKAGTAVTKGQAVVTLKDKEGKSYTIVSPRDGQISVFTAENGYEVTYGGTLGYVVP